MELGGENSEEENEMNLINRKKTQKRNKILDSDSDSEINEHSSPKSSQGCSTEKKETGFYDNEGVHEKNKTKDPKYTIDSDNSDEEVTLHNKSFPDEDSAVEQIIYTTNNKGELIPENEDSSNIQRSISALCDAESSEEEENHVIEDIISETRIQPKLYKPPRKSVKDDNSKKMTLKEAVKQRMEIRSESQRMVRESNVSLPYHKPKSYTIKEFLQKRSKLASALPRIPKAPPSIAIKMPKEKLVEVSKKFDERIKQVEEFYKSESEEEEENEIMAEEIRSWIDLLVCNAMDSVDKEPERINEEADEEIKDKNESSDPFTMDYEFNLDDIDEKSSKKLKITEFIEERVLNIQPKLSGTPDEIIDLESGVSKPSAVKKLVEKFLQHTAKQTSHRSKVELNIVGVGSGGEIIKETVSMNIEEEEDAVKVETPGAKLQKLREELQNQMAQKRSEMWKQKQEQGDYLKYEKQTNEVEYEKEKDILDDEEEEMEMTETESEEDDEEDYSLKSEKPKPKSAFIEDEADEDEMYEENEDLDDEEESKRDDNDKKEEDDDDNNEGFDGDDEELSDADTSESPKKKILKRIVKPFTEDSDDDEEEIQNLSVEKSTKNRLDSTASVEDEFIPPNLPVLDKTPQKPPLDSNKAELDFLTPVTYLTGLQNLNSDSKFLKDSPIISPFRIPLKPSPLKEQSNLQKNLFPEPSDSSQDTQDNVDELVNICSGNFPETQNNANTSESAVEDAIPSTQELLNLCSGGFSSDQFDKINSGNLEKTQSQKIIINTRASADKEIKNLDEDHGQIISQLLDEDEMERFKKKFESPVISTSQKLSNFEDVEEVNATGLINSDDENEELEVKKKKGQKKLVFSDDEDSEGEEADEEIEEEIDLHDTDDEEQLLEKQLEAQESGNLKASDFFENEAELSESDWDSADEDEKGLDDLEFEQGDDETFNEHKVRSELERIHMRQLLDEDNREVKLLQELLLEDGEMHGTGRQRQFRWKALDSLDSSEFEKREDDDIYLDEEDESEEQYRKMRHKREMFLKKKATSDDVDSILSDSQILNIGRKVIKNSQSFSSQNSTPISKEEVLEKEPFTLVSKRGSFLSRKDQVLERLAEYNKVTESVIGNTGKNSRCFVFQTVETAEASIIKENNNKRKASEGTPQAIKKLRLSDLSPSLSKKEPGKSGKFKKLFGNW